MTGEPRRRIGVTGHQLIPDEASDFIADRLRQHVVIDGKGVVGVTSLAAGADQLFAEIVLSCGGRLEVVVPSDEYETSFESQQTSAAYRHLLGCAAEVETLPFDRPTDDAYWAAGKAVVERSEKLLAVWDGEASRGLGGTADVVAYAREKGRAVSVIWPQGLKRP